MRATRIARDVSTVAVAGIAAWSSWSHMVTVALRFGERAEVAYVLPLSVDGMLVVASAAMVEDRRAGRPVRWSARIAFGAGVAASVAANITAAKPYVGARIVAAWPAIALLLVVEMLARAQAAPCTPHSIDARLGEAGHAQYEDGPSDVAGRPDAIPPMAIRDGAARVGGGGPAPGPRLRLADAATGEQESNGRSKRTADVVARLRAERPRASLAELATAAGVSQRHVRRLLAGEPDSLARVPTATVSGEHELGGIR